MPDLPTLLFDSTASPFASHGFPQSDPHAAFLLALHPADRKRFHRFCAAPFQPDHPDFLLYRLSGFSIGSNVWIEKEILRGQTLTIVSFTNRATDLYSRMDPDSQLFQTETGRCLQDLLKICSQEDVPDDYLTPAACLLFSKIPGLREELLFPGQPQLADLRLFCERILREIRSLPTFEQTTLSFSSTFSTSLSVSSKARPDDPAAGILSFPVQSCLYLLTSLLHVFRDLSDDRNIRIQAAYFSHGVLLSLHTHTARPMEDGASLLDFAEVIPAREDMLKIAVLLATQADIPTTIRYEKETGMLETTLSLHTLIEIAPTYHYRNPFISLPAAVHALSAFFAQIRNDV